MSDFLGELERELTRVAHERSAAHARRGPKLNRRIWSLVGDLRSAASGGMAVASVGMVIVVLAVVVVSASHRPLSRHQASSSNAGGRAASGVSTCARLAGAGGLTWSAVDATPGRALRGLLGASAVATGSQRRMALRDFDQTVAQAATVYVRDIRIVHLTDGRHLTLIPARACSRVGPSGGVGRASRPQPALVAEIWSPGGVATIPLGTVSQIRSGAGFRAQSLLLRSGHGLRSVAMVPPDVARVVCHLIGSGAVRRFTAIDHIVVLPVVSFTRCDLVHAGNGRSSVA